jgi:hypothetical protein
LELSSPSCHLGHRDQGRNDSQAADGRLRKSKSKNLPKNLFKN